MPVVGVFPNCHLYVQFSKTTDCLVTLLGFPKPAMPSEYVSTGHVGDLEQPSE